MQSRVAMDITISAVLHVEAARDNRAAIVSSISPAIITARKHQTSLVSLAKLFFTQNGSKPNNNMKDEQNGDKGGF